jgi:NADH dehydrogenase FAD-containing subunit
VLRRRSPSAAYFRRRGWGFRRSRNHRRLNDFVREAVGFYSNLREHMLRVVLVHPGKVILSELGEKLGRYSEKKLAERGVEILLNARVTGVTQRTAFSLASEKRSKAKP